MIGVITALSVEFVAARHALGPLQNVSPPGDPNRYAVGELGGGVVVTCLATTSNVPAADACAHLMRSFPQVRALVMCGIALGVPCPGDPERDVRLGDVVVATGGVVHYAHRRITETGGALRGPALPASPLLLRAVNEVRALALSGGPHWAGAVGLPSAAYRRPAPGEPRVFHGKIGSGDELLRSAARRDEIARQDGLLALEMEGAGVAQSAALNGAGCLVVRGVSDYGDAAKSDAWQPAASLAAAAYLRALLEHLAPARPAASPLTLLDVAEALERVPSLQTPSDRDDVLQLLGPAIAGRVKRDPRTRQAVLSLADVCFRYPDGLERLLEVLRRLEGDSEPVRALATLLSEFCAQAP
ncbi:effector-associated domain 2-containing protein [Streptosporangium longisporum]|uniref:phosphorylase family protein n=1 Tax=Streptosporangium longisporum TaxID=46187 RepID=UPI0031EF903E